MEKPVTIITHAGPTRISKSELLINAKSFRSNAMVRRIIPHAVVNRDLCVGKQILL
jgi:hypothetical protein